MQLAPPSSTTVVVHDADSGLSLAGSTLSVFKNSGSAVIAVINSNTNAGTLSVNYSTTPGTAVAGVDYTATSGTLTFTNGQTINFFSVPIIPNNLVESNRTFTVSLSGPTSPLSLIHI